MVLNMIYAYNSKISDEVKKFEKRENAVDYICGEITPARLTFEKLKSENRETIQEGFIEFGKQFEKYGNVNYEDRTKFEHSIFDQLMYNYRKQYNIDEIMQKEVESISQLLENEIKRIQEETGKKVTSIEVTKERDAPKCCTRWTYKFITE